MGDGISGNQHADLASSSDAPVAQWRVEGPSFSSGGTSEESVLVAWANMAPALDHGPDEFTVTGPDGESRQLTGKDLFKGSDGELLGELRRRLGS
ncbi:hypothetical protein CL629_03195 [bacterium]|nr:hypothetical protein [bacterium]|tara:strand:+ start:93 stop:377 length:285 start_codon:yes stop_codon:yes gene_type:complete